MKEVPTWKLVSVSIIVERLKVNGSLARQLVSHLEKQSLIKRITRHSSQLIYSASCNFFVLSSRTNSFFLLVSSKSNCGRCCRVIVFVSPFLIFASLSPCHSHMYHTYSNHKIIMASPCASNLPACLKDDDVIYGTYFLKIPVSLTSK